MAEAQAGDGTVIFRGRAGTGAGSWEWLHLRYGPEATRMLSTDPLFGGAVADALLARNTQPRAARRGEATLLMLRGINRLKGAEPEDMISLRLAITETRIVSLEVRHLAEVDSLIARFRGGDAPGTPGDFVAALVAVLREEVEPVLDELEEDVAVLESRVLKAQGWLDAAERARLADARQDAIMLHRFLAPQALAIEELIRLAPPWLADPGRLHDEAEAFRRIAADLEALRQRAQLVVEEVSLAAADRTNVIMLRLTVAAAVFLPITFLTGLLGVNLAGIPFADRPWAFAAFAASLVVVAAAALWLALRTMR